MPAFSNFAESGILNWMFRSNSNNLLRPNMIAIALCRDVPSETQHGGTIPEVANAGGYARVELGAPSNSVWSEVVQDASSSGTIENSSDITFPTASADWGWVSGMAIVTSGVYGAGQVLLFGALPTPKYVGANDQFKFSAGNIDIFLS